MRSPLSAPELAAVKHTPVPMRAHLIEKMSSAHQRGGDVAGWLPLLAQTQAARRLELLRRRASILVLAIDQHVICRHD